MLIQIFEAILVLTVENMGSHIFIYLFSSKTNTNRSFAESIFLSAPLGHIISVAEYHPAVIDFPSQFKLSHSCIGFTGSCFIVSKFLFLYTCAVILFILPWSDDTSHIEMTKQTRNLDVFLVHFCLCVFGFSFLFCLSLCRDAEADFQTSSFQKRTSAGF